MPNRYRLITTTQIFIALPWRTFGDANPRIIVDNENIAVNAVNEM